MPKRIFSPYELNQLRQWMPHIDPDSISTNKPVEYLTGHTEFCGLDFLVTHDTLIPRLESEEIVNLALQFIDDHNLSHPVIADIGTGSGCLGVSLAVKLSKQHSPYSIFLSDISPQALKVADLNTQKLLHSPENIFFIESNLFENFPNIKFDLILANLPYIPSQNIKALDSSVKDFEPKMALDGGSKGNLFINALLSKLPQFLNRDGQAILEINDTHTINSFTLPAGIQPTIQKDCFNKSRFLVCSYL
ncbi:MAG TPA: HemK/PrmC family methyltransferase [Spirochaetia bacterium]|nr:HemK/PrmC family methyltransferase [Spirochaetia bacterium]